MKARHFKTGCFVRPHNTKTERKNQPLSSPILFQNEIQKPGQKAFKKIEKHNFYLLGHPESSKNVIFYHEIWFSIFFEVLGMVSG